MPLSDYDRYLPYLESIEQYAQAINPATGSKVDANANIHRKNITTLEGELSKPDLIGINRLAMHHKLTDLYGVNLADEYLRQLEAHEIYRHDETAIVGKPYCVSITLYPFLLDGLRSIGGLSGPPKHLNSFAGGFINLVFAVASQFAGAVSTPEFLPYLDYFIRKEYGNGYWLIPSHSTDLGVNARSIDKAITDVFEQVVYSLNTPAAARNYQCMFWNIAYYDRPYFDGLFENFRFPDGSEMQWDSISWLQKRFMRWLNEERRRALLTFPVETLNLLDDGAAFVDTEWWDYAAKMWAAGHSFFVYRSDSVDSLASCCRLRNELQDNTFSYTLGAGGIATGSKCVMTINLNRLIQNLSRRRGLIGPEDIDKAVRGQVRKLHKYLTAFNEILKDRLHDGLLPIYDAGYISLDKQYLTIGLNGLVEGAEFLGYEAKPFDAQYEMYVRAILGAIHHENRAARTKELMFNTELVPAESLGVKNALWDMRDGYEVPRGCYNSYFYLVEDPKTTIIDKLLLQGTAYTQFLDGGAALHLNLDEHLDAEQYRKLLLSAIRAGCSYLTVNVPHTICNQCGRIDKHRRNACVKCGGTDLDYATRVIGYLTRISSFAAGRQCEANTRFYHARKG